MKCLNCLNELPPLTDTQVTTDLSYNLCKKCKELTTHLENFKCYRCQSPHANVESLMVHEKDCAILSGLWKNSPTIINGVTNSL